MSEGLTPSSSTNGRGLRLALAISVALNLAVAGLIAGAALQNGGMFGGRGDGARELGFGPFTEALSKDDRRDLREALFAKAPELRNARRQNREDTRNLLAALRAEPFDPAGLTAVMEAQKRRMTGQLELGQTLIRDFMIGLSPAARREFADRLDHRMHPDELGEKDGDHGKVLPAP